MKPHFATTGGALCKNRHLFQGYCLSDTPTCIFCMLPVLAHPVFMKKVGKISLLLHCRPCFVTEVGPEGEKKAPQQYTSIICLMCAFHTHRPDWLHGTGPENQSLGDASLDPQNINSSLFAFVHTKL